MKHRSALWAMIGLMSFAGNIHATEPSLVIDSGGNTRIIKRVIFTKDGNHLVSAGDDKVIRVWNLKTGKTVRTIRDQVGVCGDCKISDIALSPDNNYLAVGGKFPGISVEERFAVYIYDFQTGERLQLLRGHKAKVNCLVFSADGSQLASGSAFSEGKERYADRNSPVRVWKLGPQGWESSAKLHGHDEAISSLAFSPDGEWLASGSTDTSLLLRNIKIGSKPILMEGHDDGVYGVVFSPDGRFIVSGSLDRKIILWDVQGKFVKQLAPQPSGICSMDISSNKERMRILVGLEDGTTRILSLPDGDIINSFAEGDDKVYACSFSRVDENLVASAGGFNGQIWLWSADKGKSLGNEVLAGRGQTVWRVGFAADGKSIAFGTQRTRNVPNDYGPLQQIIHLKPPYQKTLMKDAEPAATYRISLGGKVGGSGNYYSAIDETGDYKLRTKYGQTQKRKIAPNTFVDEPVRLNELLIFKSGTQVDTIPRDLAHGRTHTCFTFTRDGRYIISGGEGGYLALYETKNPREPLHEFYGHTNDVLGVAVSPDGRFIVSGSSDQTIKLWDIESERYLLSIFVASDSEWVAWTPQGYYVSSLNGDANFGWQVELAASEQPKFYNAAQFQKVFYRPDVISQYLVTRDIQTAVEQTAQSTMASANDPIGSNYIFTPLDILQTLPPKIEILSPADKETVKQRLLPVKVVVTSENLPITDVSISLNGFRRGTFKGNAGGKEQSKRVEVDTMVALEPDENTLVVVASHEKASSKPEIRTIFYTPPAKQPGAALSVLNPSQMPGPHDSKPVVSTPDVRKSFHPGVGFDLSKVEYSWNAPIVRTTMRRSAESLAERAAAPDNGPTLEIVSPEESSNPLEVTEDNVTLKVKVNSDNPGEKKVMIFVNGLRLTQQTITSEVSTIQIPLDREGENEVRVVATSGGVESAPQIRRILFRNARPERPNLIFLGIGISGYSKFDPKLEFADKDAEEAAQLLKRLNDSPLFKEVKAHVLSNENATRANMLKEINWLNSEAVHDNDVRVLLISGHGGLEGEIIKRYYFYAQNQVPGEDPELLSVNWREILDRLLDRGEKRGRGNILLFVDTCRAGAASPKEFINVQGANGMVFFGAAEANEKSDESRTLGHGVFTKAVLEGLSGCADMAFDEAHPKDGKIDFLELNSWIQRRLEELNPEQHPSFLPSLGLRRFNIATTSITSPADLSTICKGGPHP